jgi:hypothetical protein
VPRLWPNLNCSLSAKGAGRPWVWSHANGYDSWYRGIVIWFFLVPLATCRAGLAYALRNFK